MTGVDTGAAGYRILDDTLGDYSNARWISGGLEINRIGMVWANKDVGDV